MFNDAFFQDQILDEFEAAQVEIVGEATPSTSGALEVTTISPLLKLTFSTSQVTVNGELIHSKLKKDGYVDNDKKMKKILDAIEKAL